MRGRARRPRRRRVRHQGPGRRREVRGAGFGAARGRRPRRAVPRDGGQGAFAAGGVRSAGRRGRRAGRAGARTRVRQGGEAPDESARPGGSARAAEPDLARGVSQPGQPAVPRGRERRGPRDVQGDQQDLGPRRWRSERVPKARRARARERRERALRVRRVPGGHQAVPHGARPRLRRRQGDARQDHAQRRVRLRAHGAVHGRGVHFRGRRGFKRRRCGELERRRRKTTIAGCRDAVQPGGVPLRDRRRGKDGAAFLALLSLRAYESDEEDEERAAIDAAVSENALVALRETAETGDALRAELRERRRAARTSSCARRVWWGPRSPPPPSSGTRCWRTRCARRGTPRSRTSWRWPRRWGTCA